VLRIRASDKTGEKRIYEFYDKGKNKEIDPIALPPGGRIVGGCNPLLSETQKVAATPKKPHKEKKTGDQTVCKKEKKKQGYPRRTNRRNMINFTKKNAPRREEAHASTQVRGGHVRTWLGKSKTKVTQGDHDIRQLKKGEKGNLKWD